MSSPKSQFLCLNKYELHVQFEGCHGNGIAVGCVSVKWESSCPSAGVSRQNRKFEHGMYTCYFTFWHLLLLLAQRRSSLVNNNREYRFSPPGINRLACKNMQLYTHIVDYILIVTIDKYYPSCFSICFVLFSPVECHLSWLKYIVLSFP